MKKNRNEDYPGRWVWLKKFLLVMKLMCVFTLLLFFQASGVTYSQKKVNLNVEKVSMLEVIQELRKQTGYKFFFNHNELKKVNDVSGKFVDEELERVLDVILGQANLAYRIEQGVIIIVLGNAKDEKKEFKIFGKVTDEKKQPMPGVTVKLEGTTVGTATNAKGVFAFSLPIPKGVLELSFVGFKTQKVGFNETTQDTLRITMQEDVQALDEAVVVAYGTTTRREATGAISVVKADDIKGIPTPNIASLLQGRVAGMDVTNMSGAPGGGGTAVVIRGYNSLNIDQQKRFSEPLWVVDGVPLNAFTSPVTGTNMLAEINPDMVESIQVLKDAASASIYGSRAANGVIIITTKKGYKNQDATFSANVSQTWGILPELPTVTVGKAEKDFRLKAFRDYKMAYADRQTNRYKYPTSNEEIYRSDFQKGIYDFFFSMAPGTSNGMLYQDSLNDFYNNASNFFPAYFEKGKVTNANLQTYGGSERMSYGIGLGFYDERGILKGTGFNRIDLNATMSVEPVKRLLLDIRFNASLTNRKRGNKDEGFAGAPSVETVPGDPYELTSLYPGEGSAVWDNVLEKLRGTKEKNRSVRIRSNFKVGYDVIPGLNISTSLAADYAVHRRNYFQPSYLSTQGFSMTIGETGVNLMVLNENLLSYRKTIHEDHNINFLAGFSYQYDQEEYNGGSAENSPSDKIYYAPSGMPSMGEVNWGDWSETVAFQKYQSGMSEMSLISYFARLEYNYQRKYLFSLTYRRDGSSTFGKNKKWGAFPAVAGGWVFSEENFMQGISNWFNFGKIRASWGRSGKHFDMRNAYLALGLVNTGGSSHLGNAVLEPAYNGFYNDDLSWEETDQYDFGLDLDLFDYRFNLVLDYYYRYTDKLLWPVQLPGDYNYYNNQYRNAGAISNEGIELYLKYEIFREKDLYWMVSVNGAKNWNRVEKSFNGKDLGFGTIGKPLNQIRVLKTNGFVDHQDELPVIYNNAGYSSYLYHSSGRQEFYYREGDYKFVDVDGDGMIGEGDYVEGGSALPVMSGGLVTEFRWKNFDFNMAWFFQLGRHMVNYLPMNSLATQKDNSFFLHPLLVDLDDVTFWEKPGDHAEYARHQMDNGTDIYPTTTGWRQLDWQVEKINYLKLKTLTVGYNFPEKWIERCGIRQLRIFVSGENLLKFSNYSGLDPEVVPIDTGIDSGRAYPLARKYTLGLTIKF